MPELIVAGAATGAALALAWWLTLRERSQQPEAIRVPVRDRSRRTED